MKFQVLYTFLDKIPYVNMSICQYVDYVDMLTCRHVGCRYVDNVDIAGMNVDLDVDI